MRTLLMHVVGPSLLVPFACGGRADVARRDGATPEADSTPPSRTMQPPGPTSPQRQDPADVSDGDDLEMSRPDHCVGIAADCDKIGSTVCDGHGQRLLCDECGVLVETRESCARLLAADREGGLVCAVVGEDELHCVGGFTEWHDTELPVRLPEAPQVLSLVDDSSYPDFDSWGGVPLCLIGQGGETLCSRSILPLMGSGCTDIATSPPQTCAVCDGHLRCNEDAPTDEEVTSVEISDQTVYWLSAEGQLASAHQRPLFDGSFVNFFVDSLHQPCGIRETGGLVCFRSESNGVVEIEGDFVSGAASDLQLCVITASSEVECFTLSDSELVPGYAPEGNDFVQLVATSNKTCGMGASGEISCWEPEGMLTFDTGPFQ